MSKHHKQRGIRPAPESLKLPRTGVDSHAHLDHRNFREDLAEVLARAAAAGISGIGNIFLSAEAWELGRDLFSAPIPDGPEVFFLLGVHPTDAQEWRDYSEQAMRGAFAQDKRLRALGEVGLDFYWKDCPEKTQREVFITQLRLAKSLSRQEPDGSSSPMPLVIHSREAFERTIAILLDQGFSGYPLLWHCFGGTARQAELLVEQGWHISIPGPVTFKGNEALREALRVIPRSRLLLETDCPYLSPAPYRGERNEPAYAVFSAAAVANELGLDTAELWTICGDNARRFFGV